MTFENSMYGEESNLKNMALMQKLRKLLIGKEYINKNGYKEKRIFFLGLAVWSDIRTLSRRSVKVCGVPLFSYGYKKSRISICQNERFYDNNISAVEYAIAKIRNDKKATILWIDHALGGGTETYSRDRFAEMHSRYNIIRLQYVPFRNLYMFSLPDEIYWCVSELEEVRIMSKMFQYEKIYVNSIVLWPSPKGVFELVEEIKDADSRIEVTYCVHDFYCVCPSYNLLDGNTHFCALSSENDCDSCMGTVRAKLKTEHGRDLFPFFICMREWRELWSDFFDRVVDEIIVFSHSSKVLLESAYRIIEERVKVIPHKVAPLRNVQIARHSGVNIAVLGTIANNAKGLEVFKDMCNGNKDRDVHFFVIGTYGVEQDIKTTDNLVVTGKYRPCDLPELMEEHKIDLVFIPSVCPETFSFTTSEAMSMGIPVVCYNLGAQAERVGRYEKGLVLSKIDPMTNLLEMKRFVMGLNGLKS